MIWGGLGDVELNMKKKVTLNFAQTFRAVIQIVQFLYILLPYNGVFCTVSEQNGDILENYIKNYNFIKTLWEVSSEYFNAYNTLCSHLHKIDDNIDKKFRNWSTIMLGYIRNDFFQVPEWCVKNKWKYLAGISSSIHWS